MSAIDKLGLIEFKNKTKKQKTLFDERDLNKDSNKAENMATIMAIKEKINYILTWLSESEERIIHCIICDKLCKNAYGLANHVTKTHKMLFSEYKRHVLVEAERECNEMKQIAVKYLKQINVVGYPMSKCKNIRYLFLLLKEGWK